MSDPRLTEERLRTWVLNQADRERLCLGILALDSRFSNVKPRRPKGGPDGARDIEAHFDNRHVVWGAVGFRANVTDSGDDKRWVQGKFKKDVDAARSENSSLWGFVFLTNVDLTPAQVDALEQYARGKGLSFVEVHWRERLRIVLDSPRGLSLRFQHLHISLSEAEQTAFFAEYGSKIEQLLFKGFGVIEDRLKRLEFLQDCSKPLLEGGVGLHLKHQRTAKQLGHFRFLVQILDMYEEDPHPGLWIAGRDHYVTAVSDSGSQQLVGVRSLVWSRRPDEQIQDTRFSNGMRAVNCLEAGGHLHKRGPYRTLGSLDRRSLSIYVTKPLLDHIAGICVYANDYVVASAGIEDCVPLETAPLVSWPGGLSDAESAVSWVTLALKMENPPASIPPELARTGWSLEFSGYTPQKIEAG